MSITDVDEYGVIFSLIRDEHNKIIGFTLSANGNLKAQLFCSYFYAFRESSQKMILNCEISRDTLILKISSEHSNIEPSECSFRLGLKLMREFENIVRRSYFFEPTFTDKQIRMIFH